MPRRDRDVSRSSMRPPTTQGSWPRWPLILTVSLSLTVLTCLIATHHPTPASLTDRFRGVMATPAHSLLPHDTSCVHCAQHSSIAPASLQPNVIMHLAAFHPFPSTSRFTTLLALGTAVTHCMSGLGSALCQLVAVLLVVVGWIVHRSRQYSTALAGAAPQSLRRLPPAPLGTSSRVTCVQFCCLRN